MLKLIERIGLASQTISSFTPDPVSPVVGGSYTVSGTATSGLPVTFSVSTLSVCSLNNNVVSFLTVGSCQVIFIQEGNNQFNAAPQIVRNFVIGQGTQTISFTSNMNGASVGGFANLAAVSSSGPTFWFCFVLEDLCIHCVIRPTSNVFQRHECVFGEWKRGLVSLCWPVYSTSLSGWICQLHRSLPRCTCNIWMFDESDRVSSFCFFFFFFFCFFQTKI